MGSHLSDVNLSELKRLRRESTNFCQYRLPVATRSPHHFFFCGTKGTLQIYNLKNYTNYINHSTLTLFFHYFDQFLKP